VLWLRTVEGKNIYERRGGKFNMTKKSAQDNLSGRAILALDRKRTFRVQGEQKSYE